MFPPIDLATTAKMRTQSVMQQYFPRSLGEVDCITSQCMVEVTPILPFLWVIVFVSIVGCVRIDRKCFRGINTVSLYPVKPSRSHPAVLVYVPCSFEVSTGGESISPLDDDHFCSILAEQGHIVHCVDSTCFGIQQLTSTATTFAQLLEHICNNTPITLVGNELSVLYLLRLVSQMGTPENKLSNVMQRLILIDPPPLHSLSSETGRKHILQRYFPSIATLPMLSLGDTIAPLATLASNHTILQNELKIYNRETMRSNRILPPVFKTRRHKRSNNHISLTSATASTTNNRGVIMTDALQHAVYSALSRGEISTSDLLGSDLPVRATDVARILGPGGVQFIYSGGLSANLRSAQTQTANNNHAPGGGQCTANSDIQSWLSAELLAEEDQWGAAAVQEAAAMYSALPVHTYEDAYIMPRGHDADIERHAYLARTIANIMA